ncbi:MAG: hypothetical protein ACD_9C00036G0011 [uncultured bacterium]|nr:MAG: hypothetical protein ACD_9C00036G0011 [uncultured bacterium]
MKEFEISSENKDVILALGAESAGNFSAYKNGTIYFSEDFGDLLVEANFKKYKQKLNNFLRKDKIKPEIILSDLHPLFHTTLLAEKLAKKYKAKHMSVQHHLAHILSAIGDESLRAKSYKLKADFIGIACDGTGYSEDETVWGGEILKISKSKCQISNQIHVQRIGHLEHQALLGRELAIKEPARILIGVINKFSILNSQFPINSQSSISKNKKDLAYKLVKKYYSKQHFEVLWNQVQQKFNCIETSSTARILDAVSVLLEFSKNESLRKHGPIALLEKNSSVPYKLSPVVEFNEKEEIFVLKTTPLFEYLIKNLHKDKKRLAATAQQYIANGLFQILQNTKYDIQNTYFSGGMANNKIISSFLESKGIYTSKKIPRGDAGISFGQIFYYLLANSRD